MKIKPFELERYFAKYEFSAAYLLSSSDCEPYTLKDLLELADTDSKKLWDELWLGYTESQGLPALRNEIAKLYAGIDPDQIITLVPEEGIFIAMNILLDAGDHAIVTYPGYQSLFEIAQSIGCDVTKWLPNKDTWEFDINFVKKNIKDNTKLVVVNFPHNPTGSLLAREKYLELLDICKERGIFVFSDEMYRFLEYDAADRLPSAAEVYDNAISLFGVSKTFALAGLRLGWLVSKNEDLLKKIITFKDYTTICHAAPSEVLALIALRAKDKILKRNLSIIKANLAAFDDFVARHSDLVKWQRPIAGSVAFPEFLKGNVAEIAEDILKKEGLMLLPASVYDFAGNNFRLGVGRKDFIDGLGKLEEYFKNV